MYQAPPPQPPARSRWFFHPPNRWLALIYGVPTLVWGWRFISEHKALWGIVALIWGLLMAAEALPARSERASGWMRIASLITGLSLLGWIVITSL